MCAVAVCGVGSIIEREKVVRLAAQYLAVEAPEGGRPPVHSGSTTAIVAVAQIAALERVRSTTY
eukprot:scaffold275_cov301-Prasinococcus_capsulatus_cf.AAC.5